MPLIQDLKQNWSWTGLDPSEVVGENDFGNLIIKDVQGKYWRLTPEECSCEIIAHNRGELDALSVDQKFLADWYMSVLVELARTKHGVLEEGRKYCLKIPAVLGGAYDVDNIGTNSLSELIRFSGHVAQQIADLPDGAEVCFQVVE